jgi:hypothetical protein
MTVKELINELNKVQDKGKEVYVWNQYGHMVNEFSVNENKKDVELD